jgi:hypothetical protein
MLLNNQKQGQIHSNNQADSHTYYYNTTKGKAFEQIYIYVKKAQPHTYTELNLTHSGDIATSLICYGTGTPSTGK